MPSTVMSLIGMAALLLIGFALSKKRKSINYRTVFGAFLLQFGIGAFVLYVPWGQKALSAASSGVQKVIGYGNDGINFLFGGTLLSGSLPVGAYHDGQFIPAADGAIANTGFVFALHVLPMIVFFSSLIAVLYYLGIMGFIIRLLGGALQKLLGTSRAESMSAAANIFVGQTEAPLVVKPFIKTMTQSELFAIMCGGLASIAGSVLGGYAQMGVKLDYLLAASFMAAPGGLLFAKLLIPETETPPSNEKIINTFTAEDEDPHANILDAAAGGASTGMHIALNVGAMLLAFIALVALINDGILGGIASLLPQSWFCGADAIAANACEPSLTLDKIFGYIFAPLAWLIGTPWSDAHIAGTFLGQKLAINEFYAYGQYFADPAVQHLSAKTQAIISFALCGFANFGSIAILVGGLSIMAPNRRSDVARMGIYALIAGTLSNLMSATIAGFFIGLG